MRRVGVFVNEDARSASSEIARIARLDVVQLHGDETPADYPAACVVWKAARVDAGFRLSRYDDCPRKPCCSTAPPAELYGGAGKTFDWRTGRRASHRIILAGGLDASNVAQAIALVHPWGVDACSRIESAPGRKDHRK